MPHIVEVLYSGFAQRYGSMEKVWKNGKVFPDLEKVWNFRGDSLKYGKSMEFHESGLELKVEETERKKGKGNP